MREFKMKMLEEMTEMSIFATRNPKYVNNETLGTSNSL